MRKLKFRYEMELLFDNPVAEHHYVFRCLPMENRQQRCYGLVYDVRPSGLLREMRDGFGNRICAGEAMGLHDSLKVQAKGTVFVDRTGERDLEADVPLMYRFPSAYTMPDPGIREYFGRRRELWRQRGPAKASWGPEDGRSPGAETRPGEWPESGSGAGTEFLMFLMDGLFEDFSYVPGATDVTTTAAEALAGGRGVCQDYAHIFLSLCRLAGIPARYVAGMMCGEGATHAWTEVWAGGGWTGFDPTHNRLVGDDYIKLSHGRDFGDCTVDRGCFKGFAAQIQNIHVKVEESYGEDCGFRRSSG